MKSNNILLAVLIVVLIGAVAFAAMMYNKSHFLNSEIDRLNSLVSSLNESKSQLIQERDLLKSNLTDIRSEMQMLQEDVSAIYKGCYHDNACKGHYPGVRWLCNNVGDQADNATASHICVCDSSCQLNATAITK